MKRENAQPKYPNGKEYEGIISNAYIAAFLSLSGVKLTPIRQPDGRVAFRIDSNPASAFADFAANKTVPIIDYVQRLQAVKSIIFTLKDE